MSLHEPHHEKTCFLHMPKQSRRTAAQLHMSHIMRPHKTYDPSTSQIQNFKPLAIFCGCTARFVSSLKTPKKVSSCDEADICTREYIHVDMFLYESHHEKTCFLHNAKTKPQFNCAVTVQLISAFVFAT